jgi:hypothetical protein
MVNSIKTFGLNVHMQEGFDEDDIHSKSRNLTKESRLVVDLVSTLSGPFAFENIATPSDFDE